MNKPDIASRFHHLVARRASAVVAAVFACMLMLSGQAIRAAEWQGIEPLKSRRADVERALGKPIQPEMSANNSLNFKVTGGIVTVSFVTPRFIQTKKLPAALEGTVLLIVLQHDNSSDTPESLELPKKSNFTREEKEGMIVYYNGKDGITYTFINGRLKTTRFAPAADQLAQGLKSIR